ncbi:MAG: 2-C-methyl-D-erythritol 2,4-cyclodiphosphate synthase [Xanthomonadales bacterium]|nr:2-C-methyl-D-erythritol 2,4-cyclodiphosphate synthase [Xanthomonadales bacterium]NIN58247.1 2-C-methyl-D-erythritol 2,4-cyclodiphosphate synthase [Xanthomonadales bacterium]NIN73599.1 2-C-methyl-D-erythritol 2,4-cyclodiphosphate synthase [Xanthomonadales bacterium]NIO13714.1 2-C-methyl-D-erythritol 2,4-cyclodiphosphate synthase [Xanthomonadales bacterium]NIP10640.1 2-C-methyl-D-erythritol 2,4-cyclodiphosphate synthase [Xanthomonadales bacterium]
MLRIGQGLDVHAFSAGDHVMLGGERVAHDRGIAAHSDGDVVLHALCDALLGAAALGDIGRHFPPGDARWADADSRLLLRRVAELVAKEGWSVVNVDATVICEAPRLAPHIEAMRRNIASELSLELGAVSVKATTTERLGFCGRGEGIGAIAVALLSSA